MVFLRKTLHIILFLLLSLPMMAKKPQQPAPLTTEQEQQFTYYWYAARQAINEERYADAYTLLEFCHAIHPTDGETLYLLGIMYQGLGQQDKAMEAFEQAYRVQSKGTAGEDLMEQLKRMYIVNEQWEKALSIQDELDRTSGYDAMSAITRYRIYAMWNKPKKAIKAIDDYLKTDPTNLRFLLFRVELMEQTGAKPKELYAMYDRILQVDPYNLMVLNNYAYLLATNKGDLKRAERMSEMTIREQPSNSVYLDTYGWIMHLQGQDELAQFYLKRALWNATDENVKNEVQKHLDKIKGEK